MRDLADFRLLRQIGPFDRDSLPDGLLREHRLKPGRWGLLEIRRGAVCLVWDDDGGVEEGLVAPTSRIIPPERPHHLVPIDDFVIEVAFMELREA